mgnify:CR=1 FL=1
MQTSPDPDRSSRADAPAGEGMGHGRRLGRIGARLIPSTIRGKLFLALAVITLSGAAGALVTLQANLEAQRQISTISQQNLPSLVVAYRVAERMTNIQTISAALASADTEPALESRRVVLATQIAAARNIADELSAAGVEEQRVASLTRIVGDVDDLAAELAETVETRLDLARRISETIRALTAEHAEFNSAIEPVISRKLELLETESVRIATRTENSLDDLNAISFDGLIPALSMSVQVTQMRDALMAALSAGSTGEIDASWSDFVSASAVASRNLEQMRENDIVRSVIDLEALAENYQSALNYGVGPDSLFDSERARENDGEIAGDGPDLAGIGTAYSAIERQLRLAVTLIRGRAPSDPAKECAAFTRLGLTHLVCRDSGGVAGSAKLEAAAALGLAVHMVARPALPRADSVDTPAVALDWLSQRFAKRTDPAAPHA